MVLERSCFFSILQLSRLFELIIRHLLIVIEIDAEVVLWLPEVFGVIIVGFITLMVLMKMKNKTNVISRKHLKNTLAIFFVIAVVQTCYSIYGYDWVYNMYSEQFDNYYDAISERYLFQGFMGLIGLLKYFVFGIVLYFKRDDVTGQEEQPAHQISDIGKA